MRLRIEKYFPDRLYGFLLCEGEPIFFHRGDFDPGEWPEPPPIIGEELEVDLAVGSKNRKARKARRIHPPVVLEGKVDTFNPETGWGFAIGEDDVSYYLHRSEVLEGLLPMPGCSVRFYKGFKKRRPRACYVTVNP